MKKSDQVLNGRAGEVVQTVKVKQIYSGNASTLFKMLGLNLNFMHYITPFFQIPTKQNRRSSACTRAPQGLHKDACSRVRVFAFGQVGLFGNLLLRARAPNTQSPSPLAWTGNFVSTAFAFYLHRQIFTVRNYRQCSEGKGIQMGR